MLSDEQIRKNLRHVIDASGLTQEAFAAQIGVDPNALSNHLNGSGGRKARNLLPKLIEVGINGNWFIAGIGPMYAKDFAVKGDEERRLEEIGELFQLLMQKALPKDHPPLYSTPRSVAPLLEDSGELCVGPSQRHIPGPPPTDEQLAAWNARTKRQSADSDDLL